MIPGGGQFGPQGLDWQDLCRDHFTLLHTKYISSGPHGFREEDFFLSFSHYKSMGANDPREVPQFGPQGLDWQDLCRGPLNIATYLIYKLWASWFQRRRFFSVFPIMSMGANDPRGHGQFGRQGLDWQNLCRVPLNIATY